jgi:hypothetical protein
MLWFPGPRKPEFVLEFTPSPAAGTSPSLGDDGAPSAKPSTIHSRDHEGASSLPPRLPQKRHEDIQSSYRAAPKDDPDDIWIEKYSTGLKIIEEHYQIRHRPWQPGRYSSKYHGSSTPPCFLLGFYRAIGPGTFNTSILDFNWATIKFLEEWFPDLEDQTEFAFYDVITRQEHLYSEEGKRFQLSHFDDKDALEHSLSIAREFINSFAREVIGVLGEDVHKFVNKNWPVVTRGDDS